MIAEIIMNQVVVQYQSIPNIEANDYDDTAHLQNNQEIFRTIYGLGK